MSATDTKRRPRSKAEADERSFGSTYDPDRLRDDEPLDDVLLVRGRGAGWTDVDDTDEVDEAELLDLGGPDVINGEMTVAVVPKKNDEFTCSQCFLIHHISRLASSQDGQTVCVDCAG